MLSNKCSLGGDTENPPLDVTDMCLCADSCEPHRHFSGFVECMHDGETTHGHCPQAPDYLKVLEADG